MRRLEKRCEELGLDKNFYWYHHRSHINKVTLTVFSASVFEVTIENGGEVVKLDLFYDQSFKVAEK